MKKATTVDRRVLIDAIFEDVFDLDPVNREQHFEGLQVDASIIQSVKELLALSACESGPISRPAYALLGDEGEEFKPGDTLGVYTIIREIGRGGMGVIYLARRADGQFDRNVAIKILKPGKMVFANVSQFSHEINLLAGLEHPRLCRLYNSGITPGNFPYMVMEYVNGEPFDVIHTWEQPEILQFFQMICDGVGYAHTRGIVHGDLKPENILVRDKAPVIMDFGISAFSGAQPSLHMTPRYASPEQINQLSITTQSDIYSLGLIFSEYTKRFGHAELTAISNKATATDPIERYLTLDSFSSDIVNVLTSQPVSAVK
ncbi:MAG: serine/threonine-protein kinase, partial [Bacteroidota bacterium]